MNPADAGVGLEGVKSENGFGEANREIGDPRIADRVVDVSSQL